MYVCWGVSLLAPEFYARRGFRAFCVRLSQPGCAEIISGDQTCHAVTRQPDPTKERSNSILAAATEVSLSDLHQAAVEAPCAKVERPQRRNLHLLATLNFLHRRVILSIRSKVGALDPQRTVPATIVLPIDVVHDAVCKK